jgi:hypothetical protein
MLSSFHAGRDLPGRAMKSQPDAAPLAVGAQPAKRADRALYCNRSRASGRKSLTSEYQFNPAFTRVPLRARYDEVKARFGALG